MGLFSIIARLAMDTTGFDSGARRAEGRASRMADKIGSEFKRKVAAYFGAAAIIEASRRTIEYADRLADLATQTKLSVKELQEFDYVAGQSNLTLEDLAQSLAKLGKVRADVIGGSNPQAKQVFQDAFGLGTPELAERSTKEILQRIAQTIKTTDFGANEGAILQILFGRSGERLIPLLESDIAGLTDEANRFGAVMGDNVVSSLDNVADSMTKVSKLIRGDLGTSLAWLLDHTVTSLKGLYALVAGAGTMLGTFKTIGDESLAKGNGYFKSLKLAAEAAGKAFIGKVDEVFPQGENEPSLFETKKDQSPFQFASTTSRGGNNISRPTIRPLSQGSLAAVGGFVGFGGSRDVQIEVAKESLKQLKDINQNTKSDGEEEY